MREYWRKLHYLLNRRRLQAELADELDSHRTAMGPHARSFGSSLKLREESNDAWGWGWFDRLSQDLRYGARMLRRSPGFTLTAVAILALGIGLNVSAFSLLNTMALKPLAIKDPDSIMRIMRAAPGSMSDNASYPSFDFYRRHNRVFSSMWAIGGGDLLTESGEKVHARFITPEFFEEMGGKPALGRFSNDQPGGLILSHRFWQKRFGGDPSILGKKIQLNRFSAIISGVAPPNFVSVEPEDLDLWIPLMDHALYFPTTKIFTDTDMMALRLYGRLLPGVSRQSAEDSLRPLVNEFRKVAPDAVWKDEYLPLVPGAYAVLLNPRERGFLIIPSVLLLLVLVAACTNLGNLLLARGATRAREISIRSAAGASRPRIVRQLLTESIMLSLLGAVAGVPLSVLAIRLFVRYSGAPETFDFTPDWRVGLFALSAAFLAAILFGLAPALQTSRPSPNRASRTRLILLTAQVATSCILVILSGLMTRGLIRALNTHPGFSFEQSANIRLDLSTIGVKGRAARLFLDQLRTRLSHVQGVEAVGLSILPPLGNSFSSMGHPVGAITMQTVDVNYFNTMQIPLLRGRNFAPDDSEDSIIIGDRLAQRLWPNDSPLGKEFPNPGRKSHWTVIGVAANAPTIGFGDNDSMELYQPFTDKTLEYATMVVRTSRINAILATLQKVANAGDNGVTARVAPMREGFDNRIRMGRVAALSVSALGTVALLVAIVGLAGLVSYAVTQRTREIGIRMALGAKPTEAMRVGFAQLVTPVSIGMLLGVGAAAALAQALKATLYGVSTVDPIAYLSAMLLFVTLIGVAAIGPLRRAARVDPATALRNE